MMELRRKDIVASLLLVILAHYTYFYNGSYESIDASIALSFYTEYTSHVYIPDAHVNDADTNASQDGAHPLRNRDGSMRHRGRKVYVAKPLPMDIDGDGVVEALVVPTILSSNTSTTTTATTTSPDSSTTTLDQTNDNDVWGLKVLDLKPLHKKKQREDIFSMIPLYPDTMLESKSSSSSSISARNVIPIRIASGQIIMREKKEPTQHKNSNDKQDKARHYYCGMDWNDASKCTTHCPSGSNEECPENERCFADTPCDSSQPVLEEQEMKSELVLTPRGGLPSIVTVWSDGNVTMHSVTADWPKNTDEMRKNNVKLELREMWRVNPFQMPNHSGQSRGKGSVQDTESEYINPIDFQELDVIVDTNTPIGKYGSVIIAARYQIESEDILGAAGYERMGSMMGSMTNEAKQKPTSVSSYYAIDAFSGEIIWNQSSNGDNDGQKFTREATKDDIREKEAPKTQSSMARRRSRGRLAELPSKSDELDVMTSEDCRNHFRHWIMDPRSRTLPHSYWTKSGKDGLLSDDSNIFITHFDRKHQYRPTHHHGYSTNHKPETYMKPNVFVHHNSEGINVYSLRNGRPVCHLSLLQDSLYADINQDGKIDHLQIVTNSWQPNRYGDTDASRASDSHVLDLTKRITEKKDSPDDNDEDGNLCHALLLSGIPANEELFNVHLCKAKYISGRPMESRVSPKALQPIDAAPPLLLERFDWERQRSTNDIVFALSNGVVKRYDSHGKLLWNTKPSSKGIPTWHSNGPLDTDVGFLGLIDFAGASKSDSITMSSLRPIVISGHDGLAILSSARGKLLAKTDFPQSTNFRPILADMSGDKTTDILVCSTDAIWGYRVGIHKGGSAFARIMFALLTMSIGVAVLLNKHRTRNSLRRSTD